MLIIDLHKCEFRQSKLLHVLINNMTHKSQITASGNYYIYNARPFTMWRTPLSTGPNSFVFANIFTEKDPCQRSTPPTGKPGSTTANN